MYLLGICKVAASPPPPSTSQFTDIIKLPMYACFDRWVNIVSILFPSSSIGGHPVNVFYSSAHRKDFIDIVMELVACINYLQPPKKIIHLLLYKYYRNEIIYVHKKCYLKNSFVRSPYFVHEDEYPKFFFNVYFYNDIFILYLHYLILFLPSFRGFDSKLK